MTDIKETADSISRGYKTISELSIALANARAEIAEARRIMKLATTDAIVSAFMPQLMRDSAPSIARIIAGHRSSPTADPAVAHALETASRIMEYLSMSPAEQVAYSDGIVTIIADHRAEPPDWDETEIANAGANGLARALLNDTGHGEMSPGPCADALAMVRELRSKVADPAVAHAAELETALKPFAKLAERHKFEIPGFQNIVITYDDLEQCAILLATLERERKAQVTP